MAFLAVFTACLTWTLAAQIFALLGRSMSITRLNFYKSFIGLILFSALCLLQKLSLPSNETIFFLSCSGIVGFAIGDLFIFTAFSQMGPARTMMVASLGPAIMAIGGFLFLEQTMAPAQILGLLLMILGLIFLSLEKREHQPFQKNQKHYFKILLLALIGITLDAFGVLLTKKAFLLDPNLPSSMANGLRIFSATIFLFIFTRIKKIPLSLQDLRKKDLVLILTSTFLGTFLSLLLYLYAISKENPAIIAALAGLNPVYASIFEISRKQFQPNRFFIIALFCLLFGLMFILGIFHLPGFPSNIIF